MEALFYRIYDALPRGGPGNIESTRKAFELLPDLPDKPKILDIGCGKGIQTIELAKISDGRIVAVDNHRPFLDAQELFNSIELEIDMYRKFSDYYGYVFYIISPNIP